MPRTFRLATVADIPALKELAEKAHQTDAQLPHLVFVAEQDGKIIAAVGVDLGNKEAVRVAGAITDPEFYRAPWLHFRLQEFFENWLQENGCWAYIFSITKRNKRMQNWMNRLGAVRYKSDRKLHWYLRALGPYTKDLPSSAA